MQENPIEQPDLTRAEEERAHYDKMWSNSWLVTQQLGPLTHARYRLMRRELKGRIDRNSRVIDVGCGNGTFLATLSDEVDPANLFGVEYSAIGAETAPEILKSRIYVGDFIAMTEDLAKAPFDVAVCSEVLEHVDSPKAILSSIHRVLKPNGLLVVTVPALMKYWSSQDDVAGHQRRFEYDDFPALLEDCGFKVEHHIGWGGPIARIYNRAISKVGPEKVMRNGSNPIVKFLAPIVSTILKLEDSFPTKNGFQIVTRARKA
jgi:SAM-dependent methyltransferase